MGRKHSENAAAMAAALTRGAAEVQGTPCWAFWELQPWPMSPDEPQERLVTAVMVIAATADRLCALRSCKQSIAIIDSFLEKTLESPLDSKEIKSINPKGNQP